MDPWENGASSNWGSSDWRPHPWTRSGHSKGKGSSKYGRGNGYGADGGDSRAAAEGWGGDHGWGCNYGNFYGKGKGAHGKGFKGKRFAEELQKNQWCCSVRLPGEGVPQVTTVCSYSYVVKSDSVIDVVSPAWTIRSRKQIREPIDIDLSLENTLHRCQSPNGGFPLNLDFIGCLGFGCHENEELRGLASTQQAEVIGALCALKTVSKYKPEKEGRLASICDQAEEFCSGELGIDTDRLRGMLADLENVSEGELPGLQILQKQFCPTDAHRWSFFELWFCLHRGHAQALSQDAKALAGSIWCARFWLVDLASAPWNMYDIEKSYSILRKGGCLFVGQPTSDLAPHDAMRQGHHLEEALVHNAGHEEDHLLTELQLPGLPGSRVFYSAAPDAIEDTRFLGEEALQMDEKGAYQHKGYELKDTLYGTGRAEECRIFLSSSRSALPASKYVEIKKTTHLHGKAGKFKKIKFWLQAALCSIETVIVGLSGKSDTVDVVEFHKTKDLAAEIDADIGTDAIWASLSSMLGYILAETAKSDNDGDGAWTLHVSKQSGPGMPVALKVERGADPKDTDIAKVEERLATTFS